MSHKVRKCVKSAACEVAMAGGKKHAGKKHALLVAAFAKKENVPLQEAAALVKAGVDALLSEKPPRDVEGLAVAMSTSPGTAASLLDALFAFGYFGPQD